MSKTVLFIHKNYPAQFGRIANYLANERGWNVFYATSRKEFEREKTRMVEGVKVIGFEPHREPTEGVHTYVRLTESAMISAQAVANLASKMRNTGINPDLIVAHSGWGPGSLTKTIWPEAKYIQYLEWWYNYPPRDGGAIEHNPGTIPHRRALAISRNLPFMLDLLTSDAIWVPTEFQATDIPRDFRYRTHIAFDGLDSDFFAPQLRTEKNFNGVQVDKDELILTYATRGMEPQRGFMEFMEALSIVQKQRNDFRTLIAGEDTVHYSTRNEEEPTYKEQALKGFEYDHSRLHFVGRLPLPQYRDLLSRSDVHIYFSRPFVTSWSFFEAATIGCPMIVSDYQGTREVLPKDNMARFIDHSQIDAIVDSMNWMLDHQKEAKEMGARARKEAAPRYSSKVLYPQHTAFFEDVISGKFPE